MKCEMESPRGNIVQRDRHPEIKVRKWNQYVYTGQKWYYESIWTTNMMMYGRVCHAIVVKL